MTNVTPEQMVTQTATMLDEMEKAKKLSTKVGLPKEKVGGKVYGDGSTVISIGAVHEFGGTWTHPGGTNYGYATKQDADKGRIKFLKKGSGYAVLGKTKPHTITMPQRSFLRMPFLMFRDKIDNVLTKQFQLLSEGKITAEQALGRVGAFATNISKGAFTSRGYGKWKPSKKATGQTLIDKGILRGSITWFVGKA
tara:strand:- start:1817 stop:2401 length:585 start_codon:yes stop_codon:yes gene_type:complete